MLIRNDPAVRRSGDVAAEQPKAAGSSLLSKLTNLLVADAMRVAGMENMGPALVLPVATGRD
jgi:O-phospho-L-seryl-tRNASec:L-selenocysteinyl-tRNA synthase